MSILSSTRVKRFVSRVSLAASLAAGLYAAAPALAATDLTFYCLCSRRRLPLTKPLIFMAAFALTKKTPISALNPFTRAATKTALPVFTANKGGDALPPVAVLLSTDMFSLIDEGAIVLFDEVATSAKDKA